MFGWWRFQYLIYIYIYIISYSLSSSLIFLFFSLNYLHFIDSHRSWTYKLRITQKLKASNWRELRPSFRAQKIALEESGRIGSIFGTQKDMHVDCKLSQFPTSICQVDFRFLLQFDLNRFHQNLKSTATLYFGNHILRNQKFPLFFSTKFSSASGTEGPYVF